MFNTRCNCYKTEVEELLEEGWLPFSDVFGNLFEDDNFYSEFQCNLSSFIYQQITKETKIAIGNEVSFLVKNYLNKNIDYDFIAATDVDSNVLIILVKRNKL